MHALMERDCEEEDIDCVDKRGSDEEGKVVFPDL